MQLLSSAKIPVEEKIVVQHQRSYVYDYVVWYVTITLFDILVIMVAATRLSGLIYHISAPLIMSYKRIHIFVKYRNMFYK